MDAGDYNHDRINSKNIENADFKVENYERFGNECFVFIKGVGVKG